MTLLYITNGINGSGGLERVLSVKASMLAENFGYVVHILCLNDGDKEPFYTFSPKIKTWSIKVGGHPLKYFLSYKSGIQRIINQIKPDVILVCDDGLKGLMLPRIIRTQAKMIYERHVSKLIEGKSFGTFVKWRLMSFLAKRFDKFVVLTEGNKNEWPELKNLIVISNPLSFYPDIINPLDQKAVISVGKISYQKGQDLIVKAWEIVHKKHPDWKLNLFGKENLSFFDPSVYEQMNIFYYKPDKQIQKRYLESSLYVMSSRFEGFGMVLTEAMSCGLPCISFDCNYGPSDIIREGKDGFLVKVGDVDTLAEKICTLIENETLRANMGTAAKENVKRYNPEVIVQQWDRLFKSLTA